MDLPHPAPLIVLRMSRGGAPRRRLPAEFGPWNSISKRFARWQEKGVWQQLIDRLAADGDPEWLMLDGTVARGRSCARAREKVQAIRALGVHTAGSPASCTPSPTAWATRFASP